MKNNLTAACTAISSLVLHGDVKGAERQISTIIDDVGDNQAMAIVEMLPASDLLAIARQLDSGKTSVLLELITQKKFGEIISLEGLYGSNVGKYSDVSSHAAGMISAVVFGDGSDSAAFLQEICKTAEGTRELVKFIFPTSCLESYVDRHQQILHFLEFGTFNINSVEQDDAAMHNDMSWQQTMQVLKDQLPEELELVMHDITDYKMQLGISLKTRDSEVYRSMTVEDAETEDESAL